MSTKLMTLTDSQKARMPVYVEKWIDIGLTCNKPLDLDSFNKGAKACYEFAGLRYPGPAIVVDSPMVGALAAAKARKVLQERNSTEKVELKWHDWFGGQFWVGWQAYLDFFIKETAIELTQEIRDKIDAYMTTVKSGCYWWPNKDFVMVSKHPSFIKRDERGQLHSESGKAIQWPDGWSVYSWHGVPVPEKAILYPETITKEEIKEEKNVEVRRILVERMGVSKYLSECKAKVIDVDALNLVGSAPRALMEDETGEKWLVGTDGSTSRVYTMSVPRESKTCVEAHNLISGFEESRLIAEA